MEFKHHICIVFACCVLLTCVTPSGSEFGVGFSLETLKNIDISMIKVFPFSFKAPIVAQLITGNKELFQKLENIVVAAWPLLGYDKPPGLFVSKLLPWAMDHLPDLLENQEFRNIMKIFIIEFSSHGVPQSFVLNTTNTSLNRDYFVLKMLSILDYPEMAMEVWNTISPKLMEALHGNWRVRDFLPYSTTTRPLSQQCYNDTMTFADRLIAGDSWAIDMIDAVGKPGPGIKKGLTYFIGSYDQCLAVDAHVQKNDSLGEFDDADDVSFGGRYCRASFGLPVSLIRAVVGEYENNTHGIPLRLTWGLCLPTSCHKDDVEGLLNLGLLAMFNVSAERVVCQEDQDLPNDKPAQAVIGVLGGLLLLVILSSAIELLYLGRSSGSKVPKSDDAYVMSKIHQDNTDFSSKNNVYDHMYDWRQSALARAQLKLNDEPKAELNLEEEPKTERRSKEEPVEGLNNGQAKTDEQTTARLSVGSYDSVNSATYNKAEQLEIADDTADVKLIRSFSIFTNAPRLMSTETRPDDIPTLYGIRVLSMLWVMLGNTYIYTVISVSDAPVAANLMDTFAVMKRFTFQVVLSASFATDTFFVISGCLTAYWYLTKLEISTRKVNVKTWLKFYLGKYCTLTPPYMLVMGTFVTLYMYLGHGPIWPESLNNAEHCMTDWWRHLFYVNNFVGVDGVMPEDQCMAWSWYLAVNMQFYLISPIMLTFMSFSTSMGLALTGILAVAGIVTAGVKESHYGGDLLSSRLDGGAYWNNVFTTPWCRVGAYCVGLALGCVLCKWYDKKMKKLLAAFIWLVSVCVGVLLVYITFTKYVDNAGDWTRAQQSAYESLGRPAWALCVAWVVYASSMGFAGPIGDLLSWKGFVPLSRMTYLVYLFHPILMVLVVYSRRSLVYIDDFQMSYLYLGHVVVCYGAAFVACLVFESPFRNIIKTIQGKSLNSP